jgi:type IV pilus assembly protein PilA
MKRLQKGFTLIELMIVVAIIGILAAIAIPAYNDYIGRAQVSEAFTLMDGYKTALTELYTGEHAFKIDPVGINGVTGITSGKYVASIATGNGTDNFSVVATFKTSGVSSKLMGGGTGLSVHMYYNPNTGSWTCANGDGSNDDPTVVAAVVGGASPIPDSSAKAVDGANGIPLALMPKVCT